ncbi:MAG: nucleoside hydrolase [Microbacterium sp.]
MTKVVLDVDTGIDDALAIMTAALSNEIELLACTVVWGNVDLAQGVRNTSTVLSLVGHGDVPVAAGAAGPRDGSAPWYAPAVHGADGLGGRADLGHVPAPSAESATELIIRLSHEHADDFELVAVGPLTNLAAALDADPTLPGRIRRVTIMGGAALAPGNASAAAEANILHDPEAAKAVFEADWSITMVGLDVTMRSLLDDSHRARLSAGGSAGRFAADILDYYFGYYDSFIGRRRAGNHDALAVAVAAGLVRTTLSPTVHVEVDCTDGPSRGRTVADLRGIWSGWPEVDGARHRVVLELEPGFEDAMVDLIAAAP